MPQVVSSPSGDTSPIHELWRSRRVVLIFLRQLGCRFCHNFINKLNDASFVERLAEREVQVICISLGSVEQAREWMEITKFKGELWVDTTTNGDVAALDQKMSEPYATFKLGRGLDKLRLDNKEQQTLSKNLQRMDLTQLVKKEDYNEEGDVKIWPGDVFQVGGAFVVGPGNVCDYAFRSSHAGDDPSLDDLFNFAVGETNEDGEIIFESTQRWFRELKFGTKSIDSGLGFRASQYCKLHRDQIKYCIGSFGVGAVIGSLRAEGEGQSRRLKGAIAYGSFLTVGVLFVRSQKSQLKKRVNYIDAESDVVLLTPIDIDEKVLESNLPECDCGATMGAMPMFGLRDPEEAKVVGGVGGRGLKRMRSQTWQGDEVFGSNEFQTTLCYVREFLAKPHPAVGRGGPVCPFVPTSLKKNSIYMSVVRTSALLGGVLEEDKVVVVKKILGKLLLDFIPIFEGLQPSEGRLRQFKAVILMFPDVEAHLAHEIIDAVQRAVKEKFVERGLMVGEFHSTNNASGLRNPDFYPLRTPYPCLAIRYMVPGDFVFMTLDDYDPPLRLKLLRCFLDVFGKEDKPQVEEARAVLGELEKAEMSV